jgi:long-chain fatty acid transport protein
LLLLHVPSALANGLVRDALGAVSGGRGGTNLAFGDNLALINDNPAGLTALRGLHAELGADILKLGIQYRDPQNDVHARDEVFVLPLAGVSWEICKPLPVVLGMGLFVPAGFGAEYDMVHPVFSRQRYLSRVALVKLITAAAVDLGNGFSVGTGIGPAYQQADLQLPYTFQTGVLRGVPALVDLDVEGWGVTWNLGVQCRVTERWTVGAAYIAETRLNLQGEFTADATGVVPVANARARYDVGLVQTWPRSAGLGTTYRFDWVNVSLDGVWYQWSVFDDISFNLSGGDNPAIDAIVGSRPADRFPLEWRDSFSLRLGGELFITDCDTVRAGYVYNLNSVPERTLTPLIPATLEHGFSVGYGHRFGNLSLDLAYMLLFGRRYHVEQSAIIGGDFDMSSSRTIAHTVSMGARLTFGGAKAQKQR